MSKEYHFVQKVSKYSGSLFIVIPKSICDKYNIAKGDLLSVTDEGNKIVYEKSSEVLQDERIQIRRQVHRSSNHRRKKIQDEFNPLFF